MRRSSCNLLQQPQRMPEVAGSFSASLLSVQKRGRRMGAKARRPVSEEKRQSLSRFAAGFGGEMLENRKPEEDKAGCKETRAYATL